MLSKGNHLWHLFSRQLVPCLKGEAARRALAERAGEELYLFYNEEPPKDIPPVRQVTWEDLAALPAGEGAADGADWYVVDRHFTWTYAQTHEAVYGPYFCAAAKWSGKE